ncbi:DUF4232 domain-containing protein [Streptomyces sp. NPDC046716]|uniref:DUF4232 domain-containing protein n=1 Tax=Streptomyces sp. NPDC046716 TaxID=3157093 RepID=UPI0033FDA738
MKSIRITAIAAVSVAAAFSLTACGGDDSGTSASAKDSAAASQSTGSSSSQASEGSGSKGSEAGSSTKSDSGKGTGTLTNDSAQTGGKVTFCKAEDLAIDATDASPGANEGRINITMVNRAATTCSATGFAGVDIKDADHTSNPIERGSAQPRVTTLKPGDAAVFDLAYTVDNSGDSLSNPTNIIVTPPNDTHSVTLNWPAGAPGIKGAYTDVQLYPTHNAN